MKLNFGTRSKKQEGNCERLEELKDNRQNKGEKEHIRRKM